MTNVSNNITSGIIKKIISITLPFLIRTAIIYCLGAEYLGLNSLFTSILSVLNLTELGFSSAIVFCMYKPLAEKNIDLVCGLLTFFKKVYFVMGILILFIGLVLTPFITVFISGTPINLNRVSAMRARNAISQKELDNARSSDRSAQIGRAHV